MAKVLKNPEKYASHFYDSDTDEDCLVEKVSDITQDCPEVNKKDRVLLLFTRAQRGQFVEVGFREKGKKTNHSGVGFWLHMLTREMSGTGHNRSFASTARLLGLTAAQLRDLITTHAPPMDEQYPPKHFMQQYGCEWARQDIDFYFSSSPHPTPLHEAAVWRALNHVTAGSTVKRHKIACPSCSKYYENLKKQQGAG